MAEKKRKDKPVVIVSLSSDMEAFWQAFINMSREMEWRVHDINLDKGLLAPSLRPVGAVLSSFADTELVSRLKGLGCKCIRMGNHPHPLDDEMPAILPDHDAVGKLAINHFGSRGLKDVACIVNEPRDEFNRMPLAMSQEAIRLGMNFVELSKPRLDTIEQAMEGMLKELPKPIGLSGPATYMLKVAQLAQEFGWSVPEDLAILSPVDSIQCEATIVPVSAIELDLAAQGRQAALKLNQMLAGKTVPIHTFVPPRGIALRQSTDVLAVSDPSVAQALQFMWEHYSWPLTVDDVAMEIGLSRSTLQRRFRQLLGRGVNDEIKRKRLEECGKLLRNTSKSLAEIAKLVGLRNRGYLHKAFLKGYGMTPGQYRNS